MRTTIRKISWLSFALIMSLMFSSYTRNTESPVNTSVQGKSELDKITEYTTMVICDPIREKLQKSVTRKSFSRCWSGYSPQFAAGEKAKTNSFVYGTINYYGGCGPGKYVCDFKVCVEKGYAAVRSKGSTEYIPVNEWLKQQSVKNS